MKNETPLMYFLRPILEQHNKRKIEDFKAQFGNQEKAVPLRMLAGQQPSMPSMQPQAAPGMLSNLLMQGGGMNAQPNTVPNATAQGQSIQRNAAPNPAVARRR